MNFKRNIQFYLSGSIDRGNPNYAPYWTQQNVDFFTMLFKGLGYATTILNPNDAVYQKANQDVLYEIELAFIKNCDFIIVELSKKRGIGVGAEMQFAKTNNIPVFSICPKDGNYSYQNRVHAFAKAMSTQLFLTQDELVSFLIEKYK